MRWMMARMGAHCKACGSPGPGTLTRLGLLLLCAALAAGCSQRKNLGDFNPRVHFETDFKKADIDKDELLTREEAMLGMPSIGQRFDEIDLDKNDRLNFAEIWSYVQWRRVADTPPPPTR